MAISHLLSVFLLCGQLADPDPDVVSATNAVDTPAPVLVQDAEAREAHAVYPPVPHYRADVGLDAGADTFLFRHGQTAFELEISPRLSFIVHPNVDVGVYAAAGWGGPIPQWSQMTMFGVGPFVNFVVPLAPKLTINPWVGVLYHYAFIEGYTGAVTAKDVLQFPQQSVRVDLHTDFSFSVGEHTALNVGPFFKTRLAPITEGPGTAAQLSYGLRFSAISRF